MDEEEDLCAVPPHIMRIMQVQPLQALLVLDYELIIVMKTAVAGKEEGGSGRHCLNLCSPKPSSTAALS